MSAYEKVFSENGDGGNYRLYSPPGSLTTGDGEYTKWFIYY